MSRKSVISGLRASSERVGRLYPILLDKHGNVIDGEHRLAADESWPKVRHACIHNKFIDKLEGWGLSFDRTNRKR